MEGVAGQRLLGLGGGAAAQGLEAQRVGDEYETWNKGRETQRDKKPVSWEALDLGGPEFQPHIGCWE